MFSPVARPGLGPIQQLSIGFQRHFPGLKRSGRKINHSPPSSARVRMSGAIPLFSPASPLGDV
jgi:hypothetical protein